MQAPIPPPTTWKAFTAYVVAMFLANLFGAGLVGIAGLLTVFVNRKKPAAEAHLSEAQAVLATAQAEEIQIRTRRSGKELIDEMAEQLVELDEKLRHKDDQIRALEDQLEMIKAGRILDRSGSGF